MSISHRQGTLDSLRHDLRDALRTLASDRGFTLTALGTLILALSLNVAAFTLMNTMLFRGYPLVQHNDRLVYIQERGGLGCCVAYGDFVDWRAQATAFDGMAFLKSRRLTLRDAAGGREHLSARVASVNLFRLLGVHPQLGRDFAASDAAPGAAPVAILSHAFWEQHFGGRADVVGQTLRTEETRVTVIGVMPKGFSFPEHENLWMPLPSTLDATNRKPTGFFVVARLKDGATLAGARTQLATISRRIAAAHPDTNRGVMPKVQRHAEFFFGTNVRVLYGAMWAATWFVLLIACANLANLCVARTMGRTLEFSTRLALGAGHWRMSRQILIENLLIAGTAGAGAWWLAKWSVGTYAAATASVHYVLDFSMGWRMLAYLVAVALVAGVLFTLVPVANLWRIDLSTSLKGGARGTTPAIRGKQAALIVGQMIFAVVLLSGSGVLVRSFMKFETAPLGIDDSHVLAALVVLDGAKYAAADTRITFARRLEARLTALPGVERVATTDRRPLAGAATRGLEIEGEAPPAAGAPRPTVLTARTGAGYFQTLGAPILAGRDFNVADGPSARPVAIVNQRFAAAHWPGESALGKRLRLTGGDAPEGWVTVVGVAPNIMQGDPTRQSFKPFVYLPIGQAPGIYFWTLVKTTVPPGTVAGAVRRTIRGLDPDLYLTNVEPLSEMLAFDSDFMDVQHQYLGRNAVLFPIFALSALLLAAVGLYAVVAHSVGRRTREIGVRIAIGATAADIWRWVLRQGMAPVVVGLLAGLVVSVGVNRLLQAQLIGVAFYDPVTMAVAPAVLIGVALLACRIPARRAMRVDPVTALRRE